MQKPIHSVLFLSRPFIASLNLVEKTSFLINEIHKVAAIDHADNF